MSRLKPGAAELTTDLLSRIALASNRSVNVFIARDGAEIGEYPRAQLHGLARLGKVRPSDFYWYEGMETWLLLGDLLGEEAWRPKGKPVRRQPPPEVVPSAIPLSVRLRVFSDAFFARLSSLQRKLVWIGASVLGFILVAAVIAHLINSAHSARPVVPPVLDFSKTPTAPPIDPSEVREKAAADLRQRIERLPNKPLPPRHTFYYGVTVNMRRSYADGTTWVAIVRGGENVINPETQTTTMHTDFVLNAVYRDGEWDFQHYRASVSDMVNSVTTEIDDDEKAPAPPSIVGELGLKMRTQ